MINIDSSWALLIVDYQYDFVAKDGFLKIENAFKLKPYLEELIGYFQKNKAKIIAGQDFHPINHKSFNLWPVHCVQNTKGANLMIDTNNIDYIVHKGINPNFESYSAFFDEQKNSNKLDEYLKENNITHLYVVGIATSYCVKETIIDAMKLNYYVFFDPKGCVDIKE